MAEVKNLRKLKKQLAKSTAFVIGSSAGTGFLIAEDLLLTCAHVGGENVRTQVTVILEGHGERTGKVEDSIEIADGDLSLIRLDKFDDGRTPAKQETVLLTEAATDESPGPYYAIGYPVESDREKPEELRQSKTAKERPDRREFAYEATPTLDESDSVTAYKIAANSEVPEGLSGAALLSGELGAVVGIIQYRRETSAGTAGGSVIPIRVAAERFKQVRDLLSGTPESNKRWRVLLGRDLSRVRPPQQITKIIVNLELQGDAQSWTVKQSGETSGERKGVTVKTLTTDIGPAVFGWLRRRRPQDEEEVQLGGQLLSEALLDRKLMKRLEEAHKTQSPLSIRLSFDKKCGLGDVPWELASIPSTGEHLALIREFEFIRAVGEFADADPPPERAVVGTLVADSTLRVDEELQERAPARSGQDATRVDRELAEVLSNHARIKHEPIPESALMELEDTGDQYDVLHYVGDARTTKNRLELSLGKDSWIAATTLLRSAQACSCRLVIIEILQTQGRERSYLPNASSLADEVGEGVQALVYTQFPLGAGRLQLFNSMLYSKLGQGWTMEAAIQSARRNVAETILSETTDHGAFGSPAMWSSRAGLRLLPRLPESDDKGRPGTKPLVGLDDA